MQASDDRFQAESSCWKILNVSSIFSAHHQEFSTVHSALVSFMQVFDDRFQAESGCSILTLLGSFITASTNARHLSLSWASSIQSIPLHPTSWRSILILSSHLHLGTPSGLFPSGFPTKPCTHLSSHPFVLHALTTLFSILSLEQYWVSSTYH